MKRLKLLLACLCVVAASVALAEPPKQTCCQKANAEKKECTHKCCITAHKEGKSCAKCNPNKEDLKFLKKEKEKDKASGKK